MYVRGVRVRISGSNWEERREKTMLNTARVCYLDIKPANLQYAHQGISENSRFLKILSEILYQRDLIYFEVSMYYLCSKNFIRGGIYEVVTYNKSTPTITILLLFLSKRIIMSITTAVLLYVIIISCCFNIHNIQHLDYVQ